MMALGKRLQWGAWVMLAAAVGGCSSLSSLNPFGSSSSKGAALVSFQPTLTTRTEWSASVGAAGAYVFQPAVVGSAVFAAGFDGTVARFEDGKAVWKVNAERKLTAGVGANARLAVVASEKGEVIALDAATGSVKWVHKINAEVLAPPSVGDALVVVRTSDNRLVALDVADGQRKWIYQRSNPPLALRNFTGVSFEGGVVLAGFPGGRLVAVNPANGGAIFELTVAVPKGSTELERVADISGPPVVVRQEVCAVAYQGRIGCFDGTNGNTLWSREFSSAVGLDRDGRNVFVTDDQDAVSALDVATGASLWKQDRLAKRGVSRPLVVGGYVVVADHEGYVHWLQKDDGAFAARVRPDSSGVGAMRGLGSGVVVQTRSGGVYLVAPQ